MSERPTQLDSFSFINTAFDVCHNFVTRGEKLLSYNLVTLGFVAIKTEMKREFFMVYVEGFQNFLYNSNEFL